MAQDARAALAGLTAARTPWLALAMAGPAARIRLAPAGSDVIVIDIADPLGVPVTVNPLEPGRGYPVQAHADRLAGLFEAAFGLAEPVTGALRAGLRRAYADCGWDMRTGGTWAGAAGRPAVPSLRQLTVATLTAVGELGYGTSLRAAVRGFLTTRLDPLWAGPAGHFLEGGHPVDLARLLRGKVLITSGDVADGETASFLSGVLLLRLAEQLSHGQGGRRGLRPAIVLAVPGESARLGTSLRGAAWFGLLLADVRLAGADTIVAPVADADRSGPLRPSSSASAAVVAVSSLLSGRRSAACGEQCLRRPCDGYELHAAGLLADHDGQAWLRLWVRTLVLAFLTSRPVPRVPVPLRSSWRAVSARDRECLLAIVIDAAVTARAAALRSCYDPRRLAAVIAAVAGRMLAARDAVPVRAGHVWVIPQLRWLHEMERLIPLGHDRLRPEDIAPPLDFALAGLPDWPGIRVADRLAGLRRHPLAMESERNRAAASLALLGGDRSAALDADLAAAGIGISPPLRLRHAARMMSVGGPGCQPGWLEVVLSWPRRIINPAEDPAVRRTATG